MNAFVMDVNVAIVANGLSPQANTACELCCVRKLREVRANILCIDDQDRIVTEYRNNLSMSGQPGAGDEFMQWFYQNQYNAKVCERVRITPRNHDDADFEEIPPGDLDCFDRSDRKYLAVALASPRQPVILNAVDSDWSQCVAALKTQNVTVEELCPDCLREPEQ